MELFISIMIFIVGVIIGSLISFFGLQGRPIAHLTIQKTITEDGEMIFDLKNLSFTADADKLSTKTRGVIRIHTKTQKLPLQ